MRARPLAYALRGPVERELERLQREGVITPVETADWATPIVPVVKSDGSLRICGDYKISLNKYLEVDRFPLPRVEDLFAKLHGGKKFSKIDLSQAYAQLVLDDTSKYTVINTHKGLFKYNRLIYGLSSSPGIFQRILEQMFVDIPRVGVFLDDVVITGLDDQEHLKNLTAVFERLQKYGLKIKNEKCSFMSESITYLGYVVNSEGIHTCPKKIEGIVNATTPSNVTELRSFIGMTMYYAKFVKNISTIMAPLYALLKKEMKFNWTAECDMAFNEIKHLLSSSKVLVHYSPDLPLILTTDASSYGVGGVISHIMPDGTERAIAYASRVLNKAERAYSQIDKEALGIIYSVKKFHQFLYGRRFVLRTDHKPLVTIFGDKAGIPVMAASRLQRWAVILGGYQYDIEYIPTAKNAADALSRLPSTSQDVKDYTEVTYINFVQDFLPITSMEVRKETEKDETLRKVNQFLSRGWPDHCSEEEMKPYFARRQELYTDTGCIMWGYRMVIPATLRPTIMKELHSSHQGMVKMKGIARSFVWWPGIDKDIEQICKLCAICAADAAATAKSAPQPWPYHEQAWSRLHIDFLGPFEGRMFFVIVDSTSKWIEAFVMQRTTGTAVIKVLMEIFARFGLPKEVVSDNGPPFTSQEVDQFMTRSGIKHTYSAPYHPASNGAAEGAVKLCKRALRKATKEKVDLDVALQSFLFNYRNCPHSTTGESPAMMLQKRALRCRLDLLQPGATVDQRVRQAQGKQVERFASKPSYQMKQGDPVWLQEYSGPDKWVPGTISEVKGNRNYVVTRENGTTSHRHTDQLKKRFKYCVPHGTQFKNKEDIGIEVPQSVELPTQTAQDAPAAPAQPGTSTDPPAQVKSHESKRVRRPPVRFGFEID
ncbi:uncharacterized protein K02A2.6-like [Cydia fagiglandana]|uniref:uncharacterized protein K02A2.6-like n=1 Tax=Cydia fagiglandana TaxID=1458189 RepID=UPI002FEE1967